MNFPYSDGDNIVFIHTGSFFGVWRHHSKMQGLHPVRLALKSRSILVLASAWVRIDTKSSGDPFGIARQEVGVAAEMDVASELMKRNSPRKKKRYMLLLYGGARANEQEVKTFERVVQTHFRDHILLRLEDPDEALRLLLIKNIDLIVIEPSFMEDVALQVEYGMELKKRKKVPILFMCDNELKLINSYRKYMHLYEELDDYCISPVEYSDLSKRIKRMLQSSGRAAKRFQIGTPIEVFTLDSNSPVPAVLADLSIVGAGITWTSDEQVLRGTQLKIVIPLRKFNIFHHTYGDFLNLAGRVMRIAIDGRTLGVAFAHVTQMQSDTLTQILEIVSSRKRMFDRMNEPKAAPNANQTGALAAPGRAGIPP